VGIVVLTNSSPIGFPEAIAGGFFDLVFMGMLTRDWVAVAEQALANLLKPVLDKYPVYPPPPVPPVPARPLAFYAGTYANDLYGSVEVVPAGRGLALRLGPKRVTYPLTHYNGDTFTFLPVAENAYTASGARFAFGTRGPARGVTIDYYNPEGQGTLTRVGR
jgi:uncharacterized protein DUF3471